MTNTLFSQLRPLYSTKLPERAYYLDDVLSLLSPKEVHALNRWLFGKTMIIIHNKEVITTHDLEDFWPLPSKLDEERHKTHTKERKPMRPKQFISVISTVSEETACIVTTSRQHSKELAEREIFSRLERSNVNVKRMCTRELVVDPDGVIRIVDEQGEIIELDTVKL